MSCSVLFVTIKIRNFPAKRIDMTATSLSAAKSQAVSRVLWQILWLNILVALAKISIGLLTGTVAILADGLHSTTDASANVVGLFGQRMATRPPDEDHPYGHQRFETLATLAIGGLLLLSAWEVLQIAVDRLLSGEAPEIGPLQFGVLILTLSINLGVAWYEKRKSRQLGSPILAADAQHTASDIWVTLATLGGLVLVEIGLGWMDAAVALLIMVIIGRVGLSIVRETSMVLVDAAPLSSDDITAVVEDTPGIQKVIRARSRGAEDSIQIDVDVAVPAVISAELAHNVASAVQERVRDAFPQISEVRVQLAADADHRPDYLTIARAAADAQGLSVHEVIGISTPQGKILEMHVEVPGDITLRDAHRQIDELEERLRNNPDVTEVITHIEPQVMETTQPVTSQEAQEIAQEAIKMLKAHFPAGVWHEFNMRRDGRGYAVSMHCHLSGDMRLEQAHTLAEDAELLLRAEFRDLHRVTIHTEPGPDDR
jgi:cation diffusion facilitator family transporter